MVRAVIINASQTRHFNVTRGRKFFTIRPSLFRFQLKCRSGLLFGLNRDLACLLTERLVPQSSGISSGWDTGNFKGPAVVRSCIIRMLCDHKPSIHPLVHVAVGPDNLRLVDLDLHFLLELRLGLIKDRVLGAVSAEIVEDPIAID